MGTEADNKFLDYSGLKEYHYKFEQVLRSSINAIQTIPIGSIIMWSGSIIPTGWALCDGQNGTPDLRDRFVLAAHDLNSVGKTGGSTTATLTVSNLPAHTHNISGVTFTDNGQGGSLFSGGEDEIKTGTSITGSTGEGDPFEITPPYYTLAFIMKLPDLPLAPQ